MIYLDRSGIKRSARALVHEKGSGVFLVSVMYLLLTDVLNTLLNAVLTNPLTLIQNQLYTGIENIMEPYAASGDASGLSAADLSPAYSAALTYARQMLFTPKQELLLFVFLLLFLYTLVMSYCYSGWALETVRGNRQPWTSLFDRLWMAGKFILMEILTMALVGLGLVFFLLPGVYFLYSLRLARYILLDNPELSVFQAMRRSMQLSRGYKRQIFALDLSFLGWMILMNLSYSTGYSAGARLHPVFGLLVGEATFLLFSVYLTPYWELSLASYYEALRPQDLSVGQEVPM